MCLKAQSSSRPSGGSEQGANQCIWNQGGRSRVFARCALCAPAKSNLLGRDNSWRTNLSWRARSDRLAGGVGQSTDTTQDQSLPKTKPSQSKIIKPIDRVAAGCRGQSIHAIAHCQSGQALPLLRLPATCEERWSATKCASSHSGIPH